MQWGSQCKQVRIRRRQCWLRKFKKASESCPTDKPTGTPISQHQDEIPWDDVNHCKQCVEKDFVELSKIVQCPLSPYQCQLSIVTFSQDQCMAPKQCRGTPLQAQKSINCGKMLAEGWCTMHLDFCWHIRIRIIILPVGTSRETHAYFEPNTRHYVISLSIQMEELLSINRTYAHVDRYFPNAGVHKWPKRGVFGLQWYKRLDHTLLSTLSN